MRAAEAVVASAPAHDWDSDFAGVLVDLEERRPGLCAVATETLRCVSSGYMSGGCSCEACVPAGVACDAWQAELNRGAERSDRLFRFAYKDQVWLAYGLRDGSVRGVYCPEHGAERDERAALADSPPRRPAHGA